MGTFWTYTGSFVASRKVPEILRRSHRNSDFRIEYVDQSGQKAMKASFVEILQAFTQKPWGRWMARRQAVSLEGLTQNM